MILQIKLIISYLDETGEMIEIGTGEVTLRVKK